MMGPRQVDFCPHDGGIVMTERRVECEQCGAEMVWVPKSYLEGLKRSPTERERELQQVITVKNAALLRIRQNLMEAGTW